MLTVIIKGKFWCHAIVPYSIIIFNKLKECMGQVRRWHRSVRTVVDWTYDQFQKHTKKLQITSSREGHVLVRQTFLDHTEHAFEQLTFCDGTGALANGGSGGDPPPQRSAVDWNERFRMAAVLLTSRAKVRTDDIVLKYVLIRSLEAPCLMLPGSVWVFNVPFRWGCCVAVSLLLHTVFVLLLVI